MDLTRLSCPCYAEAAQAGVPTYAAFSITTEANVYSVGDGELQDVIDEGYATIDGKTIKGLADADIVGTDAGDSVSIANTQTYTTGLTITSHDANNPCLLRRVTFAHGGTVTLEDVLIRDQFVPADDQWSTTSILRFGNNAGDTTELVIDKCELFCSDDVEAAYDPSVTLSGTDAAHTGGVSSTTITLTDSPDLSAIEAAGTGEYMIRLGSENRKITGGRR